MDARYFALTALLASALAGGCTRSAESDREPVHCMTVLARLQPGQTASDVISHECAANEEDLGKSGRFSADDKRLLIVWYEDVGFNGNSEKIYGFAGPCDSDGYGIPNVGVWDDPQWPFGGWNDVISSFKTLNHCNHVTAYQHENYGGRQQTWHSPFASGVAVTYVGDKMNDTITSFLIKRGK